MEFVFGQVIDVLMLYCWRSVTNTIFSTLTLTFTLLLNWTCVGLTILGISYF